MGNSGCWKQNMMIRSCNRFLVLSMQQRRVEASRKDEAMQLGYVSIIKNIVVIGSYLCTIIYRDSSVRIQGDKLLQKTLYTQGTQTIPRNESVRKMYDFTYHLVKQLI